MKQKIGIIGGGPAALFMYKRLIEAPAAELEITIFEKKDKLGSGMPYSPEGASKEHITNVSDNEIPTIVTSMAEWLQTAPSQIVKPFDIDPDEFNDYKVVPRLLFGEYLAAQFELLLKQAKTKGYKTNVVLNTTVADIVDNPEEQKVSVVSEEKERFLFDAVVICTGHRWPQKMEGKVKNWFDSPYPPAKLTLKANFPVAIRGASLTAIDAIRTLARSNGSFEKKSDGEMKFQLNEGSEHFRMVMHSIDGLMPAVRFHLEDPQLSKNLLMEDEEIHALRKENNGFVPLDYIFERNFMQPLREFHPEFYEQIKHMKMEEFVGHIMNMRERIDGFTLFMAEYIESKKSIKRRQSVYWKEMLAALSYAVNYPAKYFSAEDMLRLTKVLKPLISIVIAFVPQSSCRELLALHEAGVLSLQEVDRNSKVEPAENGGCYYEFTDAAEAKKRIHYNMFVDAIGQPQFMFGDFPFASLREQGVISAARIRYNSAEEGKKHSESGEKVDHDGEGNYYLQVPGIAINDYFQVLDRYGSFNERIYIMAVPFIGGYNPDYSGLDFCEHASQKVIEALFED